MFIAAVATIVVSIVLVLVFMWRPERPAFHRAVAHATGNSEHRLAERTDPGPAMAHDLRGPTGTWDGTVVPNADDH